MIPCKPICQRLTTLLISFFVFSVLNISAQDSKTVFQSKCAACHAMGKDITGPNLQGVVSKWGDIDQLKTWIRNYNNALNAGYPRAKEIINFAPSNMQNFESISDAELDAVIKYVDEWQPAAATPTGPDGTGAPQGNQNAIIFGVISLILAIT